MYDTSVTEYNDSFRHGGLTKHTLVCTMGVSILHKVRAMGFLSPYPNCLEKQSSLRLFPKHQIKIIQIK